MRYSLPCLISVKPLKPQRIQKCPLLETLLYFKIYIRKKNCLYDIFTESPPIFEKFFHSSSFKKRRRLGIFKWNIMLFLSQISAFFFWILWYITTLSSTNFEFKKSVNLKEHTLNHSLLKTSWDFKHNLKISYFNITKKC